jgi:leucyl-tRNA synthetase
VVNPNDMVEKYGADAFRIYEMFMGPFDQAAAWNTNGLVGTRKFLERIINLKVGENSAAIKNILHKTIKKVGDDINDFKFNTAVSATMILINEIYAATGGIMERADYEMLLKILAPFAPHVAEELWADLEQTASIFKESWPEFSAELIKDETINLVVQINGKMRATLAVAADISEADAKKIAVENENVKKWLENKTEVKTIFVPGKLINIVIK